MDYLDKGEMLTNRDVNTFVHNLIEIRFLCIWNIFSDILFQLSKHGTNTQRVAFDILVQCKKYLYPERLECIHLSSRSPVGIEPTTLALQTLCYTY